MTSIRVCPLCGELAVYSDDFGWSLLCTHEPYDAIEPVEVEGHSGYRRLVFVLPDVEEWKRTTGAEMLAEKAKRERLRAEFQQRIDADWSAEAVKDRASMTSEPSAHATPVRSVRRITVTQVVCVVGNGTPGSPVREAVSYYDDEGMLLARDGGPRVEE